MASNKKKKIKDTSEEVFNSNQRAILFVYFSEINEQSNKIISDLNNSYKNEIQVFTIENKSDNLSVISGENCFEQLNKKADNAPAILLNGDFIEAGFNINKVLNQADLATNPLTYFLNKISFFKKDLLPLAYVQNEVFLKATTVEPKNQADLFSILFKRIQTYADDYQVSIIENTSNFKGYKNSFKNKLQNFTDKYIHDALKFPNQKDLGANKPIYRFVFFALSIITLVGLMALSFDTPISGDEYRYIEQAENNLKYFKTFGKDTSALQKIKKIDPQYLNGQSFDNLMVLINQFLDLDDPFKLRHTANGIVGWLAIFFAALIAVMIGGYRAGIITIVFLFLAPRFLGHSFNNHRDIPMAAIYMFCIYFFIKFLKHFKEENLKYLAWSAFGLVAAFSLRLGGYVLISGVLGVFTFLYWFKSAYPSGLFQKDNIQLGVKMASTSIVLMIIGYALGILTWPYGLAAPIQNSLEVMSATSELQVVMSQLFEGATIASNAIPWYYTPKYMLMSIPVLIIVMAGLSLLLFKKIEDKKRFMFGLVVFAWLFPIFYAAYKIDNDYGEWRHFLFTFPPMAVVAALGYNHLFNVSKNKVVYIVCWAAIPILLMHSILFNVKNYPYQYTYFNEAVGGINNVYADYELDYSLTSLKEGCEWLIDNYEEIKNPDGSPLIIGSNDYATIIHYLRHHLDKFEVKYTRYYEKSSKDWDYAVFYRAYISPFQIKNKLWPPQKVAHNITVDNASIGAVIKRASKEDLKGFEAAEQGNHAKAVEHFNNYIEIDPYREEVWVGKATSELNAGKFNQALSSIDQALALSPLQYDSRFYYLHYYRAIAYYNTQRFREAIEAGNTVLRYNGNFQQAYDIVAKSYDALGDKENAQRYRAAIGQ